MSATEDTSVLYGGHARVPIPDPTELTTAALDREVAALKELIFSRLNEMEKATAIRVMAVEVFGNELRSRGDERVAALRSVQDERFTSIQLQLRERDARAEQVSKDNKLAFDAALLSAKEAVSEQNKSSSVAIGKSETATLKQIDSLGEQIRTSSKATDDKIGDLKDRVSRIETAGLGIKEGSHDKIQQTNWVVGLVVGIVLALMGFASRFIK